MLRSIILCLILHTWPPVVSGLAAQEFKLLHSGNGVSLRGLSAVTNSIIWVSGHKGSVGRSLDGGASWEWMKVTGYETRDFRDVEAFDKYTALIMAVDTPAVILKTIDGGRRWKLVYSNHTAGMFLDAMEFWNDQSGIVIGDPVNGKFFVARTFDGGFNWRSLAFDKLPAADSGEACFAASGTNVRAMDRDEACFVSGGTRSRLFWKGEPIDLPLAQGSQTSGANSVAVWFRKRKKPIVAVAGGDFLQPDVSAGNFAISLDGGEHWTVPDAAPRGYRSSVEFVVANRLITCGTTGVDISADTGKTWRPLSDIGFHACRKSKKGHTIFLAGADGRIGKIVWK